MPDSKITPTPQNINVLMLLSNAFNPDPRVHREALALVENGYNVTILCWDRDLKCKPFENIDGVRVERIYLKSTHGRGITQIFFLVLFWLKAFFLAHKKNIDIVHAHDFDTLPLGYFLAIFKRAKLVYDAHESYVDMLYHMPHTLKRIIYLLENFILKRSDLVITVGEILKEYLVKRGAKMASVVGNWQDPKKFRFDIETLRRGKQSLGIADNQIVISFIANLGSERQLPQLISAVKETPDSFLIVGGDGPYRELAAEADRVYQNIKYLGYVHPSKVPFYTALSDVIFYGFEPSNPNAKFSAPNKLFEGIAAGKAIITADFGEIGKIVRELKCGIILDCYSKKKHTQFLFSVIKNKTL